MPEHTPRWKVGRTGLITTAAVLWWLEASTTQRTTAARDAALARAPAGYARGGWGKGHGHVLPMMFRVAPCAKMAPQWVSLLGSGREDRGPTRRGKTMAATLYRGDGHMAQKGRGIFMVYVDIDAQHVQEFNEWYNTEHLPELLAVPGILSAARYEAVKGGPQYLACYELESVAVMQTPAFTNRPRTPWGQKVSPSVIGKNLTRIVGEQIYPDGIEMPDRGMAPVLQIGRMSVPAEVEAEWNAWYSGEYVPGYRKVPGVIYARRYRVLEGTSGYSTVYEFASTAVPESPEWKEQQQHSSPNSPRMRQAMTHAPGSAGVYVRVHP